jgi:hypothetical protein
MRQEFERHRYVSQIGVVDMLLFQSHAEYQVGSALIFWKVSRDMRVGLGRWNFMDFGCHRSFEHELGRNTCARLEVSEG